MKTHPDVDSTVLKGREEKAAKFRQVPSLPPGHQDTAAWGTKAAVRKINLTWFSKVYKHGGN